MITGYLWWPSCFDVWLQVAEAECFPRVDADFSLSSDDISIPIYEPIQWKYPSAEEEIRYLCHTDKEV